MEGPVETPSKELTAQQYLQDILNWRAQQRSSDNIGSLTPKQGPGHSSESIFDISRYDCDARSALVWTIIHPDHRSW